MALFPTTPDQGYIDPERGPVGQFQPIYGPLMQGQNPSSDGGIYSYAPDIDAEISNNLLDRNPFPDELVPPFRVRPGDNGGGALGVGNGGWRPASVDLNGFDPVTREVQQEELTSYQLERLLAGDSAYMQDARRRGLEVAGQRGALNSSISAGASQRSAIQAGAPIAQADAGAYIQAASENLQAVNQNILAKMNAATAIATTNSQVSGSLAGSRLANDSRERIAETQLNAQYVMQQSSFVQQQFMEQMQQTGRVELQGNEHAFNYGFQEQGFQNQLYIEETYGQPRFEAELQFNMSSLQSQVYTNLMANYAQGMASMNGLDLDDAARARGQQFWLDYAQSGLNYVSSLSDTAGWPPFDFDFGP